MLVYDRESHQAHCLNRTAALVFLHSDGVHTLAELASELGKEAGTPPDERIVRLALRQLESAGLLDRGGPRNPFSLRETSSRREALKQVGLGAAVLLPVVTSLLVPSPAEAANTCIPVEACPSNNQQPCYNVNPATECPTNKCIGFQSCG